MEVRRWLVLGTMIVSLQACQTPAAISTDSIMNGPTAASHRAPVEFAVPHDTPDEIVAAPIEPEITPPAPDLWQTLRDGFALSDDLPVTQPRLRVALDWIASQPRLLEALEPRAQRYLPYLVQEVQARGLPLELALLPIVESTLDPYAASPQGAAGLWQLIPATARRYGVAINWWYDGRRDVVDSTDAALDYLATLHTMLGDWLLVIAAYNCGERRILRAIEADPSATFWSIEVPRETARYVPRVLALAAMIRSPDVYGATLPSLTPDPAFGVSTIDEQVDLSALARHANIPLDEIFRLNPGLNHAATPPEGPHRVIVPLSALASFESALDRYGADTPQWTHYRVRNGDTLGTIARRHNTSVLAIRDANALRGHLIRAGDTLLIPRSAVVSKALAANPLLHTRNVATTYRVASGDSLWSISRRFGTSVGAIVKANRLNPRAPLGIGQTLRVPGRSRSA